MPNRKILVCMFLMDACADSCTVSDIRSVIGALSAGDRATSTTSVALRCTSGDNSNLEVTAADFDSVDVDDVIIAMKGRVGVEFSCTGNCGSKTFLKINGEKVKVEGFGVDGFGTGIEVNDDYCTIQDMTISDFSVSGVANTSDKYGTEIRDVEFDNISVPGGGSGVRATGTTFDTAAECTDIIYESADPSPVGDDDYPAERHCYNMAVYDSTFVGVGQPVNWDNDGRFLVARSTMTAPSGTASIGSNWGDDVLGGDEFRARVSDVTVDGGAGKKFATGMRFGGHDDGGVEMVVDEVEVKNASKRGVWADRNTDVYLRASTVRDNGGSNDSNDFEGGVVAGSEVESESPEVDAGTDEDTDPGDNVICNNINGAGISDNVVDATAAAIIHDNGNTVSSTCP